MTSQDFFNCNEQFPSHSGFRNVPFRPSLKRSSPEIRIVMQCQENDLRLRIALFYPLGDLYAAHLRHRNIENTKIRLQSIDCFQEFRAITQSSQNVKLPSQQLHNLVPYLFMIIRN